MKIIITCFFLVLVAGCSSNRVKITFDSYPPGAVITSGETNWGTGPVTMVWKLEKDQNPSESEKITATWISGAMSSATMTLVAGTRGSYVFNRPQGFPGLEADIHWATNLQQQDSANDVAQAINRYKRR